ncbi:AMP-binding enzyme, partial [Tahibacter aquaticus]
MHASSAIDAWFPLSSAQNSRWFLYQVDPAGQGNHNNVFSASLRGRVDEAALSRAIARLAARHPMLRARLRCLQGQAPQQCIAEAAPVPLRIVDASGLDSAALQSRVSEDAYAPFDLSGSALFRAVVYRRSESESAFLFALDHLICDGWSYWLLLEELGKLLSDVQHSAVADKSTVGYSDYVAWQREWLAQDAQAQRQFAYWESQLAGELPVLNLPGDSMRPAASGGRQRIVTRLLDSALTQRLGALARQQAATLFSVLLAGYQALLHRYAGQDDIVVGAPMPGRGQAKWDGVVGDFVNVIALRTTFGDDPSVAQLLRRVRGTALKGMAQQEYPFSQLVERLQPARGAGVHPFFQALFVFQNARRGQALSGLWNSQGDAAAVRWGELELRPFALEQRVAGDRLALALQTLDLGEQLRCDFAYDSERFDAAAIERLADSFVVLLDGMCTDSTQRVSRLPLLSPREREQVLLGFNATQQAASGAQTIASLFEAQVARAGTAPALRSEGETYTYAELNQRANRLAHALLAQGVKPDQRVAICVQRGLDLVVGLLGILKAGAAYVPLDPAYPADRLAYMLADCAPVALLTQGRLA